MNRRISKLILLMFRTMVSLNQFLCPLTLMVMRKLAPPLSRRQGKTGLAGGNARGLKCVSTPYRVSLQKPDIIHTKPPPAAPASTLVVNRNGTARSPTPPSRIIRSTYGGNLFTADDVLYLKKYIDYCRDQGLVLRCALEFWRKGSKLTLLWYSLREICERIAIRAPHHTYAHILPFSLRLTIN